MNPRPTPAVATIIFSASMLLPAFLVRADNLATAKPLATRVQEADKVFVSLVINRKLIDGDWCHADLKVTRAIKGCEVGQLIPVVWRPVMDRFDAVENQVGLALLKPSLEKRYWLRADTFDDATLAGQAVSILSGHDFERQYVQRGTLTTDQEKVVVDLAQKCGIKRIARISSYNLFPSAAIGISVQGVEKVEGQEVSCQVLQVKFAGWCHSNELPRQGDHQIGDFWAGQPTLQTKIILEVGGTKYRTGTIQGLSIKECEVLLERFLTAKYTCGPSVSENRLDQINWGKPLAFRKQGEGASVSFNHKQEGGGFFDLEITPTKDGLVINQVLQAVP
ncbi:hypothetical protein OAA19_00320 [Rubripirellula sp.]|nr:hypothetical protein [Rubripirellula sp.]MDB4338531.1 hypothetical protein [Rubripirellula sp.]